MISYKQLSHSFLSSQPCASLSPSASCRGAKHHRLITADLCRSLKDFRPGKSRRLRASDNVAQASRLRVLAASRRQSSAKNRFRACGYGGTTVGTRRGDGQYPEDLTHKCIFLTTSDSLPAPRAELLRPGLIPPKTAKHRNPCNPCTLSTLCNLGARSS